MQQARYGERRRTMRAIDAKKLRCSEVTARDGPSGVAFWPHSIIDKDKATDRLEKKKLSLRVVPRRCPAGARNKQTTRASPLEPKQSSNKEPID